MFPKNTFMLKGPAFNTLVDIAALAESIPKKSSAETVVLKDDQNLTKFK